MEKARFDRDGNYIPRPTHVEPVKETVEPVKEIVKPEPETIEPVTFHDKYWANEEFGHKVLSFFTQHI